MKEIQLTQGQVAIVDDEDVEKVSRMRWHAQRSRGKWYAGSNCRQADGSYRYCSMHRIVLDAEKGQEIDHIDGNALNNTRANLRFVTHQQNVFNRGTSRRDKAGYKGISMDKRTGEWKARIAPNGTQIYLGRYPTQEEAAIAYDSAAREYYGEFAWVNFPDIVAPMPAPQDRASKRLARNSRVAGWVEKYVLLHPYGKCQCGCGEDAPLAKRMDKRFGHIQGQPVRYINNHHLGAIKMASVNWGQS